MTAISNNDIASAIYLISKGKTVAEQAPVFDKVVKFLFRSRLLSKAPDILGRLSRIIDTEEKRIVAKVRSAETLDESTRKNLASFLKKHYSGESVIFEEIVDKGVLGGMKIEVGSEVIDLTIKNRIEKLQDYLLGD